MFYTDAVTEAEADALGTYLIESEFADGEKKTVQLNKTGKNYEFRMVVKEGTENNQEYIKSCKIVASKLSANIFNGKPVEIHLCDDKLETIQVVVPL